MGHLSTIGPVAIQVGKKRLTPAGFTISSRTPSWRHWKQSADAMRLRS
jgi:hypothetical protein